MKNKYKWGNKYSMERTDRHDDEKNDEDFLLTLFKGKFKIGKFIYDCQWLYHFT